MKTALASNKYGITENTKFVVYTIWTDTQCFEVVGNTAKTLRLRGMNRVYPALERSNAERTYFSMESCPYSGTFIVRLSKKGTFHVKGSRNPLHPTEVPIESVDNCF